MGHSAPRRQSQDHMSNHGHSAASGTLSSSITSSTSSTSLAISSSSSQTINKDPTRTQRQHVLESAHGPFMNNTTFSTDHPRSHASPSSSLTMSAAATIPRRATFTNTTGFRPYSDYLGASLGTSCSKNTPCPYHSQTKSQRQFARCFPELAELHVSSSPTHCAPCLATPPHTPPDCFSAPSSFALPSFLQARVDRVTDVDDSALTRRLQQRVKNIRDVRQHENQPTSNEDSNHATSIPTVILSHNGTVVYSEDQKEQCNEANRSSFGSCSECIVSTESSEHGEGMDSVARLISRTDSRRRNSRVWGSRSNGSLGRQRRPSVESETERMASSFTKTLVAPIAIEAFPQSSAPSIKSLSLKSPTPPPSLLSPSLTTTKISRSSSTVQSVRGAPAQGMAVHTRKESQGGLLETADEGDEEEPANPSTDRMERSASHQGLFGTRPMFIDSISAKSVVSVPALRAVPPSLEPIVPIACGCSRHYSHAILSTIVPLSVAACFEVLFSGIGTGSGDVLLKEAHRTKNGSTALKLSDWRHADTSAPDSCHFWENKKRQLEYSVSLKIPLLTKTSTTCSETLDIVHFSDDVILVHSETKTPNVPYAEHFSTVSQMCLTWDSHGNTRVKCFAEINFSKKLVFGNKIEVSLLESSSEYYRELVSRLVDYAEHLELGPVIRAIGSGASAHTSHKTTLSNGQTTIVCSLPSPKPETMPALVFKVDSEENAKPDFRHASISSSANATEMSPAFSLLSQQHLRHPPSQKTGGRVSMDNLRSSSASLLPVPDKTKRAATVDKKSALSFIQNILKPTSIPDVTPSTIKSNESTAHKADNVDVPSKTEDPEKAGKVDKDSAVVALWSDIKRFSVALFTKDTVSKDKDKAALAILATERKASALAQPGASETPLPTPITSGAPNSQSEPNSDAVGYTIAPNMPAKHTAQLPAAAALKRPAYQWLSLRAIVGLFMVVMAISVMNMWYLFGVVSSVVQVVQEKHDYTSFSGPFASIPLKTKTPSSFTSRPQPSLHVHSSESLAPIQTQTDVLRAEIRELLGLLELARREIHQSDN